MLSLTLCTFSAFGQEGTVIYNDPVQITFSIDGVFETLSTRSLFVPASDLDCADVDLKNIYSDHEWTQSSVDLDAAPAYLHFIFEGLPAHAENIEVTYYTCEGF